MTTRDRRSYTPLQHLAYATMFLTSLVLAIALVSFVSAVVYASQGWWPFAVVGGLAWAGLFAWSIYYTRDEE